MLPTTAWRTSIPQRTYLSPAPCCALQSSAETSSAWPTSGATMHRKLLKKNNLDENNCLLEMALIALLMAGCPYGGGSTSNAQHALLK